MSVIRVNFVYHHCKYTSIYMPLSYFLISLVFRKDFFIKLNPTDANVILFKILGINPHFKMDITQLKERK